ncbi:hypothetical protein [Tannockella kyphosi]|uniref:hypothetical protein n=1 Tax=Tannockella kyphosi TaxID=2899121 RepID=UPI0020118214|nr:hypothetical protein [Tannockella kyphosi]
MKNINEIKKSIILLTKYPHTFAFEDFGNSCITHLDKMSEQENLSYAKTYASVLIAMPKYSDLHKQFAPILMQELGLTKYPRYDYMVKLLTRILEDDEQMKDSATIEQMCLFTTRVQSYLSKTGKTKLESSDLKKILG